MTNDNHSNHIKTKTPHYLCTECALEVIKYPNAFSTENQTNDISAQTSPPTKIKMITIDKLNKRRESLIQYLLSKVEAQDWHACSDAANDLREIDAQLVLLEKLEAELEELNE